MVSRRDFLAITGASAAGALLGCGVRATIVTTGSSPAENLTRLDRIGVQLFSMPKLMEKDVDAAFAMLFNLGYQEAELYGPFPFSAKAAQDRWKAITPMVGFSGSGFYGLTAQQFRAKLDAHGLTCPSAHMDLDTLRDNTGQVAEAAHGLGMTYAGIASTPDEYRTSLDGYRKLADDLNAIGAKAKPLGFKLLYHNHGEGFIPMDGQIPARVCFDRLDPSVVSLEMDVFWTTASGSDPVELLDAYPKLYRLMHVKDMSRQARFTRGADMQDIMSLMPVMTPAGSGVLDLVHILGHARRNGVEHFYVEQDLAADPQAQLGTSIMNLRAMTLAV